MSAGPKDLQRLDWCPRLKSSQPPLSLAVILAAQIRDSPSYRVLSYQDISTIPSFHVVLHIAELRLLHEGCRTSKASRF